MQNKIKMLFVCVAALFCVASSSYADLEYDTQFEDVIDVIDETDNITVNSPEDISADAIEEYQVEGSLFQQITDLEQEKILMQLEKERAQLNLDLDRLAAEKIKLHLEIDNLSGRAEQQQQELEAERARLEAEARRMETERNAIATRQAEPVVRTQPVASEKKETEFEQKYKLVNVFGAGAQLQATVQDLESGQNKRISVGKEMDGYTVKSISLDDGIVFVNGDEVRTLNISGKN